MNRDNTFNRIRQESCAITQRELAERANRADAVIATVSIFGLVVLLIVQLAEQGML